MYGFLETDIDGFDSLTQLALDMRWSWNHSADALWRQLDPKLWDLTHNPWVVLQTTSQDALKNALTDTSFRKKLDSLMEEKAHRNQQERWFQKKYPKNSLSPIAYFSMEFMLSEALPIYSGGLGNVAGDQLKAASDLGVPVIAVGLLYQQGYFRQVINKDGAQEALYPYNDPLQLPITPLRLPNGEWLRMEIQLPGHSVWLRTWEVQVGKNKLYLLDSNDMANFPAYRNITCELYGGGREMRLLQEMVLGIAGWRLLSTLNIQPQVCHLNEGHAAFAILERARCFMKESGQNFESALATTRVGNLFTTHTAVAAGFDLFSPQLIEEYLSNYAQKSLGISLHELLALGRANPNDPGEEFNMAYLAMRGCGAVNGVSRLHGEVSRRVFSPLFPRWPEDEVPIGYVTNGIHTPSWDSELADELWTNACGKERWRGTTETLEKDIRAIPDALLWNFRQSTNSMMINYVRNRYEFQQAALGASKKELEETRNLLDPAALTLGFARRFATYKRPNLLLHDPVRLVRILTNPQKPVQLLIAGKAHPEDKNGQALIQQWTHFIKDFNMYNHVMFLSDYDMVLTEQMVRGVDVWINTPRRPWEACGTSGMKVLVNGGINLSELDGWWAEAYTPEVGWAIGDGKEHGDDPAWDAIEANQLYDILEKEVVPAFYTRDQNGIPTGWVSKMRESMARLTPQFSANRAVREYTEKFYIPAAEAYAKRSANKGEFGSKVAQWQEEVIAKWPKVRWEDVKVQTKDSQHFFEAQINLDGLDPENVRAELYSDGVNGQPELQPMTCYGKAEGGNGMLYKASVNAQRPAVDYTLRVIPRHDDVRVPLEANEIVWQK
jgi:starch phosphorylase